LAQIVIVAKVTIKEEFIQEVYPLLESLHKSTHANDFGCIQYDLHKDLENPNSFTFVETWENTELLDAHMQKEHFLSFVKNVENKLENLEISKLEKKEL